MNYMSSSYTDSYQRALDRVVNIVMIFCCAFPLKKYYFGFPKHCGCLVFLECLWSSNGFNISFDSISVNSTHFFWLRNTACNYESQFKKVKVIFPHRTLWALCWCWCITFLPLHMRECQQGFSGKPYPNMGFHIYNLLQIFKILFDFDRKKTKTNIKHVK